MYKHYNEDKDMEVEVDDDVEGYIRTTYVSDKLTKEVGKKNVDRIIRELIDGGAIDEESIKDEQGYKDYMEEAHGDDIRNEAEEEEENARAWKETLDSLPR